MNKEDEEGPIFEKSAKQSTDAKINKIVGRYMGICFILVVMILLIVQELASPSSAELGWEYLGISSLIVVTVGIFIATA